jgi:hypothetical protein
MTKKRQSLNPKSVRDDERLRQSEERNARLLALSFTSSLCSPAGGRSLQLEALSPTRRRRKPRALMLELLDCGLA